MKASRAVVTLNLVRKNELHDIDVPLDINAAELLEALDSAYHLGLDLSDSSECFVKSENPIALIHGRRTLGDYGIMNGSIINVTD